MKKFILLFICCFYFILGYSQNNNTSPPFCVDPNFYYAQPLEYINWTEITDFNCNGNFVDIYSYTKDGYVRPVCTGDLYGTLTLVIETLIEDNSNNIDICFKLNATQELLSTNDLTNVVQTDILSPDQTFILGTEICGTIDLSNESNGSIKCSQFDLKYNDNVIASAFSNKFTLEIFDSNGETCVEEFISLYAYLETVGNVPIKYVLINQGVSNLSSYLAEEQSGDFWYIPSNSNLIFDDNVSINSGLRFVFGENASLTVPDGSSITFENCEFFGCDQEWSGIIVENNAQLIIDESKISNADKAITLQSGATLELKNGSSIDNSTEAIHSEGLTNIVCSSSFVLDCNTGIHSVGNPNIALNNMMFSNGYTGILSIGSPEISSFENNTFEGYNKGMSLSSSENTINLVSSFGNENVFTNNRYGVALNEASVDIQYGIFNENQTGLLSWNSPYTRLKHSFIDDSNLALDGFNSILTIAENFIGTNSVVNSGVNLILCESTDITQNTITAYGSAVSSFGGVAIDVTNLNQLTSLGGMGFDNAAAVRSNMDSRSTIARNTIVSSSNMGGVFLNSPSGMFVTGNNIYIGNNVNTSGVRVNAGRGTTIAYNDVTGLMDNAVTFLNTSGNTLECNELYGGGSSLWVGSNADYHNIQGNVMDAVREVYTRSVLSPQEHKGNVFLDEINSTIVAEGDALSDITDSRFVYDTEINPLFEPKSANPPEMKLDETDYNNRTFYCNNGPGAGYTGGGINSDFLCQYLSSLEKKKYNNTRQYFINIYHIYAYYLKYVAMSEWPSCLRSVWDHETLCGVKELVEAEAAFYESSTADGEVIRTKKAALEESRNTEERVLLLLDLKEAYLAKNSARIIAIAEIKANISRIACREEIVQIWKRNLIKAMNISTDHNTEVSISKELESDASLCADEYGDGVHWARAIAALSSNNRYDVYDTCFESIDNRSSQSKEVIFSLNVSPNPANDLLLVEGLTLKLNYTLRLVDIQGRVVYQEMIQGNQSHDYLINIESYNTGLYFLNVTNDTNDEVLQQKIVIQH